MVIKSLVTFIVAFVSTLIVGVPTIKIMNKLKAGQNILSYVDNHKSKSGTPTIGGIMFILPIIIATLIFGYGSKMALVALAVMLSYGAIGFLDDYLKLRHKENLGLKAYQKVIAQIGIAIIVSIFCYLDADIAGNINIPFSNIEININYWIIPIVILFYVAMTNATNLIDGIDGLASGVTSVNFVVIGVVIVIASLTADYNGNVLYAKELAGLGYMAMACFGGVIGFLCFNCNPAKIFMGDTGSLALGGALASILAFSRNILLVFTIGLMLIVTTLSVIIQVMYFKFTKGKRVWLMSPLHHHYQYKGVSECRIVTVYTAITVMMGVICIISVL